jgi:Mrp family chromosome partitioning ATPase/capsular polysaccharide biosynthesis protein
VPSTEDIRVSFQLTETYGRLVTTTPVLDETARRLGLPEDAGALRSHIDVATDPDTQLVGISASWPTPEGATALADAVADEARGLVRDLGVGGALIVVEPAGAGEQVAPNAVSNVAIGLAIGVTLALLLVLLLSAAGGPVASPGELPGLVGLPALGSVRGAGVRAGRAALLDAGGRSAKGLRPLVDDHRLLQARLELAAGGFFPGRVVMMTAPRRGSGTSAAVANLALVAAAGNARVLVIDADVRAPAQHRLLDVPGAVGIGTWTSGESLPEELVQPVSDRLDVLPAGDPRPVGADVPGRVGDAVAQLRGDYDLVLVDAPPVTDGADSVLLAQLVDGCVLVVDADRTPAGAVVDARRALEATRTPVLGIVTTRPGAMGRLSPLLARTGARQRASASAERVG